MGQKGMFRRGIDMTLATVVLEKWPGIEPRIRLDGNKESYNAESG